MYIMKTSNSLPSLLSAFILAAHHVSAYDSLTCCELAKAESQFLSPVPTNPICGQAYNPSIPAAEPLFISYAFCSSECKGIELSRASDPNQWAASLVQFLLPSVIFSMSIPRRKRIEFKHTFEYECMKKIKPWKDVNEMIQLLVSMCCFAVMLVPVTIDNVCWIATIIVGAGDMIVSGLYEAILDYRIVKFVNEMGKTVDEKESHMKRELLVTVTSGNLMLNKGSPFEAITRSITIPGEDEPREGKEKARSRLLSMLESQTDFGAAIGSAVLFYLGAFVYTLLALKAQRGDEDSAFALGFGIEWMVIVNVAIVNGTLLASDNPSAAAGIVGSGHEALDLRILSTVRKAGTLHHHRLSEGPKIAARRQRKRFYHIVFGWTNTYDTDFQPVSLWSRGSNKMKWIEQTEAFKSPDGRLERLVAITPAGWIFKILLPALTLTVAPPALAGIITYYTPPRGVGCRTLSCLIYACCQAVTTILATIRCALDDDISRHSGLKYFFIGWGSVVLSSPFWFGSFVSAIGGIMMQTIGVFRNCICASPPSSWVNINKINPSINLATDTQAARDSSIYWLWMGTSAVFLMTWTTYIGWWYQESIRRRFRTVVKEMFEPESIESLELREVAGNGSTAGEKKRKWMSTLATPQLKMKYGTSR